MRLNVTKASEGNHGLIIEFLILSFLVSTSRMKHVPVIGFLIKYKQGSQMI